MNKTTIVENQVLELYRKLLDEKDKEIERLNNIINKTEEYIEKEYDNQKYYGEDVWLLDMVMNKIKELKGADKE